MKPGTPCPDCGSPIRYWRCWVGPCYSKRFWSKKKVSRKLGEERCALTRDEFIELLKENAEANDLIVFEEEYEGNGLMLKPSGVQRWSAEAVIVRCEPIVRGCND